MKEAKCCYSAFTSDVAQTRQTRPFRSVSSCNSLPQNSGGRKLLLTLLFIIAGLSEIFAQSRTKQYNVENGLAIQGYDPVAYFIQNKAIKGSRQFSVIAEGVTYYLSSEVNKNLFIKDYKKYEPQYGGWCAYAMGATGQKVEIDPKTFKILQGKLYLFYHAWTNNTLPKWNADETNLRVKADQNWNSINH